MFRPPQWTSTMKYQLQSEKEVPQSLCKAHSEPEKTPQLLRQKKVCAPLTEPIDPSEKFKQQFVLDCFQHFCSITSDNESPPPFFITMHQYWAAMPWLIRTLICLYQSAFELCRERWRWMTIYDKLLHNKCKVPSSSPSLSASFLMFPPSLLPSV